MKIHALTFHNKAREWVLQRTTFKDITLLVGISGVGKTQILNTLMTLKRIAKGRNVQGVSWAIEFSTTDDALYVWEGEFAQNPVAPVSDIILDPEEDESQPRATIEYERLTLNGSVIIDRNGEEIRLRGELTPKLSQWESVLNILNREAEISPAYGGFGKIIRSDQVGSTRAMFSYRIVQFEKLLQKYDTLEKIQESEIDTYWKLALAYKHKLTVFDEICRRFIGVFPQVERIIIEPVEDAEDFPFENLPVLHIKEIGVPKLIPQRFLSAGMFRTLLQLADMFLSPDGTVILVDEFENSLGINCIDVLTEDLLFHDRRLQFIVTSHHPYIINNISPVHWKIVRRKGGVVTTEDASDLHIGSSSHESFLQLINSVEYREGITAV